MIVLSNGDITATVNLAVGCSQFVVANYIFCEVLLWNMGVHCEINLCKPANGAFVPGSTVSGVIKYAVDEDTVFSKISVSLKGNGSLNITDESKKRGNEHFYRYRNSEQYVDIENIIHNSDKSEPVPFGAYEIPFTFTLPQNIPPSLKLLKRNARYTVRCNILYYISIKFDRPGLLKFAKKMRKEITVISGITPRLPMEPMIYGEQKKIFQLFSRKANVVTIKANIVSCVVIAGGKVSLTYEILNQTNLNLKGVETKLIEVHTFTTAGSRKVKLTDDVKNTDSKCGSLNSGASLNMAVTIEVPSELRSLEYSNLVARDYFVEIKAEIPFPHFNARLEIPLQIYNRIESTLHAEDDPPPSYWEAMAEDTKQDGEDGDGVDDKTHGEKS